MPTGGEGDLITGAGIGRPPVDVGRLELDGAGQAELAEGPHVRVARERGLHLLTEKLDAGGDLTGGEQGLEFAERGPGDGAGERIAREGVAVEESPLLRELAQEGGVDLLRRQRGRERQVAGGEPLREAEEIRDDALELGDGERTDPTEAREDFIEDEVDAMLPAQVGDGPHKASGLLDHPGGPLHAGLEDHAGRRGGVADEQGLECGQRGGGVGTGHLSAALGVLRRREGLCGEEPRVEAAMKFGAGADRHRAEGIAVVGAFHRDDPALGVLPDELPILEREFEGDLDGVAAVVGEEAPGQGTAAQTSEVLGQLRRDRVVQAKEGDMRDLLELLAQGAIQVGVVVAMDVRPDRGVAVEVTLPFPVDQPVALAAHQVEPGIVQVLLHLGERVPPEAPVGGVEGVQTGRVGCGGSRHPPVLSPA